MRYGYLKPITGAPIIVATTDGIEWETMGTASDVKKARQMVDTLNGTLAKFEVLDDLSGLDIVNPS